MEFSAAGRVGSCHEGVIKTIKTQKPQYVTLGNGDRIWGGAQDHEGQRRCAEYQAPQVHVRQGGGEQNARVERPPILPDVTEPVVDVAQLGRAQMVLGAQALDHGRGENGANQEPERDLKPKEKK